MAQFADDTTLILDGTEKSLYAVLNVLNLFARFSGLKINTDKTRLLWIRSKKRSKYKLCNNYNFDWTQSQFNLLGINFDVDLETMVGINYFQKYKKIELR